MIKDRMTLALSIDTQYLKTTVDAMSESDETLSAYAVGFIPWDLVQESTLFNWKRYNVKYTYNVAASINPVDSPYTDGTQLSATKGIPFMYAVSPTPSPLQFRALYKSHITGDFASAGNTYKSGTTYNTTNTDMKNILHSIDLSDIVSNTRNATPYMQAQFTSIAILYDGNTYDFDNAFIYTTEPINYNPVTDSIDSFTCRYVINGAIFTRTITDADFKTWGKMGYSGTIETGGHKYAIFDYCVGIYCVNSLQINGYPGAHVNGFIAYNFPFRYTSTIGLHDSYNYPSSGGFSGFQQGYNATDCACGFDTRYSSSPIDWKVFVNNDSAPTIDVILNNNDRSEITEAYYRYKTSMAFSVLMKSYTALDLKIMALISTPIVKINNAYYCPEFDENYALTGNWVEYTNQNINPDINDFDPADIPEPTPPGEDEDQTGGVDWNPNTVFAVDSLDGFVTMYALRADQISRFGQYLWAEMWSDDFLNSIGVIFNQNLSLNPSEILNYIVSVRCYPFSISGMAGAAPVPDTIYLGRGAEGIDLNSGFNILRLSSYSEDIDGGTAEIPAYYGDFRDYEPCSKITVFVPFCGALELAPSQAVGNKVHLRYCVDFSSGAIQATVSIEGAKNNYIAGILTGTVGATVELSASNLSQVIQKVGGLAFNVAKTAALFAIGGEALEGAETLEEGSKALAPFTASAAETISSVADMSTGVPTTLGTTAGFSAFQVTTPIVRIERRHYEVPDNYAHVYGYACNYSTKLETLKGKGYTVCKNVDLEGVPATQDELALIEQLLQSGVYF